MRQLPVAIALWACGCSTIFGADDDGIAAPARQDVDAAVDGAAVDGGPSDGAPAVDAPTTTAPCDPSKPFGPLERLAISGANNDRGVRLSGDMLGAYFSSDRSGATGASSVFFASRASTSADFGAAQLAPGLDVAQALADPTITGDGLTIYVEADLPDQLGKRDLYVAVRASTAATFGALSHVANVNSADFDRTPFVTKDGSTLYFSSDRGGSNDIYRSTRQGGAFTTPVKVSEVSGPGFVAEMYPVLSDDGLTLYFARDDMTGQYDVWKATRANGAAPFGAPSLVAELAAPSFDAPTAISPDGCTLYVTSDRPGTLGGTDMYRATKPR